MDYRQLLLMYIRYVTEVEGADYIEHGYRGMPGDQTFTPAEWAELERLSREAWRNG